MGCHFVVWTLVLALIETGAFKRCRSFTLRASAIPVPRQIEMDEDVLEEEQRVSALDPKDLQVRVSKFRKVYTTTFGQPFLAVERISFGLEYGECFALLGVNGAGKTTTFKSLTNEVNPTTGNISICGFDIMSQFGEARKNIGYTPQHDAIFDMMTVEEHL